MDSSPSLRCEGPALDAALAELDAVVSEMRKVSKDSLRSSEQFARTVRAAKPSRSDPAMYAVKAGPPADDSDLTGEFAALRRAL